MSENYATEYQVERLYGHIDGKVEWLKSMIEELREELYELRRQQRVIYEPDDPPSS